MFTKLFLETATERETCKSTKIVSDFNKTYEILTMQMSAKPQIRVKIKSMVRLMTRRDDDIVVGREIQLGGRRLQL